MLNPLKGGIRMYHSTNRGKCTLITPFPEYIPTGSKLQVDILFNIEKLKN